MKKTKSKANLKKKYLKNIPRRIPEDVLKETLDVLHDDNDPLWFETNKTCFTRIDKSLEKENIFTAEISTKLKYAQKCLLKRDFKNLSKILAMDCFNETQHTSCVLPTFAKYAALCLVHEDLARLDTLFTILTSNNVHDVLALCTSISSLENKI